MARIAEAFLQAAMEIVEKEHTNILVGTVLKRRAESIGGYKKDSILPSDYCYNYVNRASYSCRKPLFVWKSRNKYEFIGPDAPYNGPLIWRKADGTNKEVGIWVNGVLRMFEDPRE